MGQLKFKHADQMNVYPKLIAAVNKLCEDKGRDCLCVAGYRSLACQIATAKQLSQTNKGSYQDTDPKSPYYGAVYNKDGQRIGAAYGKSNHCFGLALDIETAWFKKLTNKDLARYGLIKPMDYEDWHVELIETKGLSLENKKKLYESFKDGDEYMDIKEFQQITGLAPDGIIGSKTKSKAKEVLEVCQQILGIDYKTPEELIKATMDSPAYWLNMLDNIKFFRDFITKLINKMKGGM